MVRSFGLQNQIGPARKVLDDGRDSQDGGGEGVQPKRVENPREEDQVLNNLSNPLSKVVVVKSCSYQKYEKKGNAISSLFEKDNFSGETQFI